MAVVKYTCKENFIGKNDGKMVVKNKMACPAAATALLPLYDKYKFIRIFHKRKFLNDQEIQQTQGVSRGVTQENYTNSQRG